jgi:hypothetical protein
VEKIIYALWRDRSEPRDAFNARLLGEVASLLTPMVRALRINVQDDAVATGTSPRITSTRPQMEAVVQLWLDSANDAARAGVDAIVAGVAPRHAAWLASESTVLPNRLHTPAPDERTEGFSQIVFLGLPPRLSWTAWRNIWERQHSAVAVDTQANFEYVQNLIVRPLTYGAPSYVAMIEECFPAAALHDEAVYFDAVGDAARLAENQRLMMESCARFIDFDRIDCIPTSQFDIRRLAI